MSLRLNQERNAVGRGGTDEGRSVSWIPATLWRATCARLTAQPVKTLLYNRPGQSKANMDATSIAAPIQAVTAPELSTGSTNANVEVPSPSSRAFERRSWMKYELAQRIVGRSRFLRRLTLGLFARFELLVMRGHKDREVLRSIRRSRRVAESLLSANEAFLLHSLAGPGPKPSRRRDGRVACLSRQFRANHLRGEASFARSTFSTLSPACPIPGQHETRALTRGQYAAKPVLRTV